ncbi:hypothetical protein JI666_13795 [Bacillus sp. NTK071]|uniref:hypothetical protein n=1 Tax=Bacillus sp. NTK071 TaxID=2802175 RepID=UPI001A8C3DB5|nr:hypothetical protein [Bacillus sp. NTK071]MBN8209825.1 hypothetical protein [Bacillus sp. NTK071]
MKINIGDILINMQMGWSFLCLNYAEKNYLFPIVPMISEPVYISDITIKEFSKEEFINVFSTILWNRGIRIENVDQIIKGKSNEVPILEDGTLESTKTGKEFIELNLFNPNGTHESLLSLINFTPLIILKEPGELIILLIGSSGFSFIQEK